MPNHVTNTITFPRELAERVREDCFRDGAFTFEELVPCPPHMYRGDLGADDERDFRCNWSTWSRENWGTKWDAYDSSLTVDGDRAELKFDTAWSTPRPIIVAFANRYRCRFTLKSYDEGHNFWLIEEWGTQVMWGPQSDRAPARRMSKRESLKEDQRSLCIELKGYDPNDPEDDDIVTLTDLHSSSDQYGTTQDGAA
jgi:hypothetical protein